MRPSQFREIFRYEGRKAWFPSMAYAPPCDPTKYDKYNPRAYERAGLYNMFRDLAPSDYYITKGMAPIYTEKELKRIVLRYENERTKLMKAWLDLGLHRFKRVIKKK